MLVKKYGNRRLYDTTHSSYITLEELAEIIRGGEDVRVVDAKRGDDLTNATLAQIIIEGRGAARMLPVPLLTALIRMGDDALAEFLGQYMTWALEVYVQARQGAQTLSPFNPFGGLSRLFTPPPPPAPKPAEPATPASGLQELRRELDELKQQLKKRRK